MPRRFRIRGQTRETRDKFTIGNKSKNRMSNSTTFTFWRALGKLEARANEGNKYRRPTTRNGKSGSELEEALSNDKRIPIMVSMKHPFQL